MGEFESDRGNLLFDVWLVSRATSALIDTAVKSSGLDADEFAVYSVLASGGRMTPTELARWMAAPTTTVSSYISRFEKRGHLKRVTNPEDGRSRHIELTPAGRRAHQQAGKLFTPVLNRVAEQVGDDAANTRQQLQALRAVIDSVADDV